MTKQHRDALGIPESLQQTPAFYLFYTPERTSINYIWLPLTFPLRPYLLCFEDRS